MNFLLASANAHKALELNELFENSKLKITPASRKLEIIEDGETFQANAFKKARGYYEQFKTPTLADDSGLVIPARTDILGVHSARYAPEFSDYKDKNAHLLLDISQLVGDERKAYFVCYFCFYLRPDEVFFFEGRVHGVIAQELTGEGGFGYDPIFLPDGQGGKSFAETPAWKMQHSHRAKAAREALKFFQNYSV